MPKPEPIQYLPRLLSAALVAGCVWMLLQTVVNPSKIDAAVLQRQIAPYAAALSSGDMAKARALFDRDIHGNPADPGVYELIATACEKSNRYDLALEYLNRGVEACRTASADQRAGLYISISDCYQHTEKKPQRMAILAARNALDLVPENPQVLNAYGYLLADNGEQLDEAVMKISHALELLKKQPDTPDIRLLSALVEDSYGWALYKQRKYDAALSAIGQAISDVPRGDSSDAPDRDASLGELYYHLGAVYNAKKDFERARSAFQTAIKYDPKNKEANAELMALKSAAPTTAAKPAVSEASAAPLGGAAVSPAPSTPPASAGAVKRLPDYAVPTRTDGKPTAVEASEPGTEKHR